MWLLRNDSKGLGYRVTPGKDHVVSRKGGDLILADDQSISRKHAVLRIDEKNKAVGIVVQDLGSKYGTFTMIGNGELTQLPPNKQATLKNGDTVKFGIQWNCWRAEHIPLLVTHSTLSQDEKSQVKELVESLGGQVVNDWQVECTHLTMNKLTVTIKVVCALASAQPIVTPVYWRTFSECLSTMQTTLPDCKDFLPPLAEEMLNSAEVSFMPNPARSKLFSGCTFVAASAKQLSRIRPMIMAAGGKVVEFSVKIWTEEKLSQEETMLMLSSASDRQGSQQSQVFDGYMPIARKLKSKGIRCIPESEIGLSVLYCSMDRYCNPRFSNQSLVNSSVSAEATQHVSVMCPNTQEDMSVDQDNIDTVPGPSVQAATRKRALENEVEDEGPASKKPQRQHSEDLFGSQDEHNLIPNKGRVSTRNSSNLSKSQQKKTHIPSLDIFASSDEKSGPSGLISRQSVKPTSSKCQQENVKTNHIPSLDMFASLEEKSGPSGVVNKPGVRPSGDLFASTESSRQESKDLANDEFSFLQTNERRGNVEQNDEFSFSSTKNTRKSHRIIENGCDKSNAVEETKEEDTFSFATTKRPNKRTRKNSEDMFASSAESSLVNISISGPSKSSENFSFRSLKPDKNEDNLFAFPEESNSKRRRVNGLASELRKTTQSDVELAILSNERRAGLGTSNLQQDVEVPDDTEHLITYSKSDPVVKKEEEEHDEVDDLARELCNATIVIVKPLVVAKEKPQNRSAPEASGKNFKKFRKVVALNKRIVPHIIGGNDLVPHYELDQVLENNDSALARNDYGNDDDDDDDWNFDRKKTTRHVR